MMEAGKAFSQAKYRLALNLYEQVSKKTSKVYFNIGRCYQQLKQYEDAQKSFHLAFEKDPYLVVAYFEAANCSLFSGKYETALKLYEKSKERMSPSMSIDYEQIGLDFVVDVGEILFNESVALAKLGNTEKSTLMLQRATKCLILSSSQNNGRRRQSILVKKLTRRMSSQSLQYLQKREILDILTSVLGMGYICECPESAVFRPHQSKIAGLQNVDYLGKAEVVIASNPNDIDSGFRAYRERKKEGLTRKLSLPVHGSSFIQSLKRNNSLL